jgi:2-methylcitrate dehydratase PrpD
MLAAAIVGYEMAAALGRLAPGAFQQHGFQSTAVLGAFAATAIAARLLKLSKHQAVHALGIAGSMASGLMEYLSDGSDVKQMHPGWAAQSGIRAAQLASRGFTGPSSIFEGRFGIYQAFARTRVRPEDARERSDGWEVEEMAPKPYPACLCVHPQVQAVLELCTRGALTADAAAQIADIRCDVPSFYVGLVYEPTARKALVSTAYEARFSAAYCIARALLDGRLDLHSFDPDKLRDPRALAIAGKVTYRVEALPEFPESFPARVTVTMTDGVQHKSYVRHNLGSARNPLTSSQLQAKFAACAVRTLGSAGAHALAVAIRELPTTPDREKRAFRSALRGTLTGN